MHRLLGLSDMKANTQWAPLALLGYRLQQRKFFEPLYQNLDLHQKQIRYTSQDKLITCLVSIMSDCQAISHIDTRIRPDRALAQAWGLECFAHQSIVADTLNRFTETHVAQLRQAVNTIYLREGRAVQHDVNKQGLLILDVDLTGLPASKHAQGSRKGYFKCLSKINFIFVPKTLHHPFHILDETIKAGIRPKFDPFILHETP
jgi:hypothetical protein